MNNHELIRVFSSVENNPIILTNIMTQAYYDNYYTSYDLEYGATELINEFYCIHYSDKFIGKDQISRIIKEYYDNIPMLILCVYLLGIDDDPDLKMLAIPNMSIIYGLILNAYNHTRPVQKLTNYNFTASSVIMVLSIIQNNNT